MDKNLINVLNFTPVTTKLDTAHSADNHTLKGLSDLLWSGCIEMGIRNCDKKADADESVYLSSHSLPSWK